MASTTGFSQFASLAALSQPSATPGPIRRTVILNMTSGGIENYSGPSSTGLGTVLEAGVCCLNGTSVWTQGGITVTNTVNSDTTLALYSGSVRFTNNSTNTLNATAYVISTT